MDRWMDQVTLSLSELARALGIGRSAVANWRQRHPTFPAPVEGRGHSARYALGAVYDWAVEAGRDDVRQPRLADWLWRITTASTSPQQPAATGQIDPRLCCLLALIAERAGIDPPAALEQSCGRARARLEPLVADALTDGDRPGASTLIDAVLASAAERLSRSDLTSATGAVEVIAAMVAGSPATTLYDPAIGLGHLALGAAAAIGTGDLVLHGAEIDPQAHAITQLRAELRGLDLRLPPPGDSLEHDPHPDTAFDLVVADLPIDPRSGPNPRWFDHIVDHLTPNGRALIIAPGAIIGAPALLDTRQHLLATGRLRSAIRLPSIWQGSARARSEAILELGPESTDPIRILDAAHWRVETTRRALLEHVITSACDPTAGHHLDRTELERKADGWTLAWTAPDETQVRAAASALRRTASQLEALTDQAAPTGSDPQEELASVLAELERRTNQIRRWVTS
jgi:hypothetical protein